MNRESYQSQFTTHDSRFTMEILDEVPGRATPWAGRYGRRRSRHTSPHEIDPQRLSPTQSMAAGITMFVLMVITLLFTYFFVSAAMVPVVVQLMIAPLRPVSISTAIGALKRRWRILKHTPHATIATYLISSLLPNNRGKKRTMIPLEALRQGLNEYKCPTD